MAIHIFCPICPICKKSYGLEAKECSKCGTLFGKSKKYRVCVSEKGKRITKVVDNLTLAREWETAKKTDILRGDLDISQKSRPARTLDDIWSKYLPWAKEHKKSWKDDNWYFSKHIEPRFGNKLLGNIAPIDIERMKKELKGMGYAPATIKHQIVILRRLFNLARKWDLYEGKNPVDSVKMPKVDNQVTEFLKHEELDRLFQVLEKWPCKESSALIKFAIFSGFRKGEILRLAWEDVNFERGMITLKEPKGGKTLTIHMSPQALEVIKGLKKISPYVFAGQGGKQMACPHGLYQNLS
jgi:integrase